MAVEILENTLLKLLVRRGTDADRRLITLGDGELGYTTDTERLFVGNSTDQGGVVVGNKYAGANANLLSLAPAVTGDYAFETDTNELNVLTSGTGAVADNWTIVANKVTAGDTTIDIDSANKITVGKFTAGGGLSADNISPTALGDSITLDGSQRVSLSANVNIDGITKRSISSNYLSLPNALKIGTHEYDWPTNDPQNRNFLGTDANNNLRWTIPNIVESAVAPTSASVLPVGTIVPYVSSSGPHTVKGSTPLPIPYGWLSCDGASVNGTDYRDLSGVIGISYGGDTTNPDTATTFNLPNLTNKLVYGSFINDTANSSLYPLASGVGLSASPLSGAGVNYIIKSVGGVSSPTLTVGKNLSAFVNAQDKTDTTIDFLSGDIKIEKTPPGQVTFPTGGVYAFTMPDGVHFVKYYVTGSGATAGASRTGGAGATAIGYLSAGYRTRFTLKVANAPDPSGDGIEGEESMIALSGLPLITAQGGKLHFTAQATIIDDDHVLNGLSIPGGPGMDGYSGTGRSTSVRGSSSYWGSVPAPGGGQTVGQKRKWGSSPGPGLIVLEWT